MQEFSYARPATISDAIAAVSSDASARFIAGGTTLIDLMKLEVENPAKLLDIRRLPLSEITETSTGGLRIGAMATNSAVAYHPAVKTRYPLLAEALLSGASPQLRNMATAGGNLLQRTRCTYFRDPMWACNKREPGSGCSAREGLHRNHAILGTSEYCFASNPSDMAVALVALDALIEAEGPKGQRRIPVTEFYRLPGKTPHLETVLERAELITAIELPPPESNVQSRYEKVRDRESYEFALASVAAILNVADGVIYSARVGFGGVGTIPWRARNVEATLSGERATTELFRRAAERAVEGATPHRDNVFKVELLKRTLIRVLRELCGVNA